MLTEVQVQNQRLPLDEGGSRPKGGRNRSRTAWQRDLRACLEAHSEGKQQLLYSALVGTLCSVFKWFLNLEALLPESGAGHQGELHHKEHQPDPLQPPREFEKCPHLGPTPKYSDLLGLGSSLSLDII